MRLSNYKRVQGHYKPACTPNTITECAINNISDEALQYHSVKEDFPAEFLRFRKMESAAKRSLYSVSRSCFPQTDQLSSRRGLIPSKQQFPQHLLTLSKLLVIPP